MLEPPTGVLDANNNNHHLCHDANYDEEVHFSRFHVSLGAPGGAAAAASYRPLAGADSPGPASLESPSHHAHFAYFPPQPDTPPLQPTADQARSSRLLNQLGSRLRRGSNYLAAPALVGQYLLGVTVRAWCEFLDASRMRRPPHNAHQLSRRLASNLTHFQGNYLCVALILVVYCILTSPLLLLAILAYLAALYALTVRSASGRPLKLPGLRQPTSLSQQYSCLTLLAIPLLWVAGAPSALFWVVGASCVVVGLHAAMYRLEEPEAPLPAQLPPVTAHQQQQYYRHLQPAYLAAPTNGQPAAAAGYASALSQWISGGGGGSSAAAAKPPPTTSQGQHSKLNNHRQVPQVTIISQDFAGLGRVYEI